MCRAAFGQIEAPIGAGGNRLEFRFEEGEMTTASVDFAALYARRGSSLTSPVKRLELNSTISAPKEAAFSAMSRPWANLRAAGVIRTRLGRQSFTWLGARADSEDMKLTTRIEDDSETHTCA